VLFFTIYTNNEAFAASEFPVNRSKTDFV